MVKCAQYAATECARAYTIGLVVVKNREIKGLDPLPDNELQKIILERLNSTITPEEIQAFSIAQLKQEYRIMEIIKKVLEKLTGKFSTRMDIVEDSS